MDTQQKKAEGAAPTQRQQRVIRRAAEQHVEFADLCLVAQKDDTTVLSFLQSNPLEPQPFVVAQVALDARARADLQRQLSAPSQTPAT